MLLLRWPLFWLWQTQRASFLVERYHQHHPPPPSHRISTLILTQTEPTTILPSKAKPKSNERGRSKWVSILTYFWHSLSRTAHTDKRRYHCSYLRSLSTRHTSIQLRSTPSTLRLPTPPPILTLPSLLSHPRNVLDSSARLVTVLIDTNSKRRIFSSLATWPPLFKLLVMSSRNLNVRTNSKAAWNVALNATTWSPVASSKTRAWLPPCRPRGTNWKGPN